MCFRVFVFFLVFFLLYLCLNNIYSAIYILYAVYNHICELCFGSVKEFEILLSSSRLRLYRYSCILIERNEKMLIALLVIVALIEGKQEGLKIPQVDL